MSFKMYRAGGWKAVSSAPASSPQAGSSSDQLQEQVAPNDKEQRELTSPSNGQDVSRSRSVSQEPNPDGSDCSDGSDEEEDSSSPVKTITKCQRSSSGSASPEVKQLSKSRSPTDDRKLSRSTSSPRRSTSKSATRRKQSRFVVWLC